MPHSKLLNELNALIAASDYSQSELARDASLDQGQLSKYLSGKVAIPLEKYERLLDLIKPHGQSAASLAFDRLEAVGLLLTASPGTLDNCLHLLRRDASPTGQEGETSAG